MLKSLFTSSLVCMYKRNKIAFKKVISSFRKGGGVGGGQNVQMFKKLQPRDNFENPLSRQSFRNPDFLHFLFLFRFFIFPAGKPNSFPPITYIRIEAPSCAALSLQYSLPELTSPSRVVICFYSDL